MDLEPFNKIDGSNVLIILSSKTRITYAKNYKHHLVCTLHEPKVSTLNYLDRILIKGVDR